MFILDDIIKGKYINYMSYYLFAHGFSPIFSSSIKLIILT